MRKSALGQTGIAVSAVGLGCGNFGGIGSDPKTLGKGNTAEEASAIMDRALDMGINFFDTANSYGGGRSESYIGQWLKKRGGAVREKVMISTKVFHSVSGDAAERGLSRDRILWQADDSLKRLGTDHIDLYLIHEPDPATPEEETLGALNELIQQGKVRFIGACNMSAKDIQTYHRIAEKNGWQGFGWIQNAYSLLERGDEAEVFPLCKQYNLGYTPFSPLAGGWLTGKYRRGQPYPEGSRMTLRPDIYSRFENDAIYGGIEALEQYAHSRHTTLPVLALAWAMSHPQVTAPIVGLSKDHQFEQVEKALEMKMDEAERVVMASRV